MSLVHNDTPILWKKFMSNKQQIINSIGTDLYCVQSYNSDYFKKFSPANEFEKWAAIEVSDFNNVPKKMKPLTIPSGLYAVFLYKGASSEFYETAQYIFGKWLPQSDYILDDRPHFEVLGEKYINNHPDSEETIWIPIKTKP